MRIHFVPDWYPEDPEAWKGETKQQPSPVSVPVTASSETAALRALISAAGGTMPAEGEEVAS